GERGERARGDEDRAGGDPAKQERHGERCHRGAQRDLGEDLPDPGVAHPQLAEVEVEEEGKDRLAEAAQEEPIQVEASVPAGAPDGADVFADHAAGQDVSVGGLGSPGAPLNTFPSRAPSRAGSRGRSSTSRSGWFPRTRRAGTPPPSHGPGTRDRRSRGRTGALPRRLRRARTTFA